MSVKDKWEDARVSVYKKHRDSLQYTMWSCMTDYTHAYVNTEIAYICDVHNVKVHILKHLTSKQ